MVWWHNTWWFLASLDVSKRELQQKASEMQDLMTCTHDHLKVLFRCISIHTFTGSSFSHSRRYDPYFLSKFRVTLINLIANAKTNVTTWSFWKFKLGYSTLKQCLSEHVCVLRYCAACWWGHCPCLPCAGSQLPLAIRSACFCCSLAVTEGLSRVFSGRT